MSFTETTTRSWFARLKSGLIGLILGPILVLGMIWLLSWNEGRSVQTYRSLTEGEGITVSIDSGAIDRANEGKLVHLTGNVIPQEIPEDTQLAVSAEGAVGLRRRVEMYQWIEESQSETRKTLGGGEETVTTYSYRREWRSSPVDSSNFRQGNQHYNPEMPIESERFTVANATVGAFGVDGKAVADLADQTPVRLTADDVARISSALAMDRPVRADGTTIYVSNNRQSPAVGDLRISFAREDVSDASFVGAQRGDRIVGYRTSNGRNLFLSAAGAVPAAEMFETARSVNAIITWLVRAGGLLGMFIGFAMMLSILGIIADIVPFVGSIVGFGTSLIALVLTLLIGPVVIAIAWIAYRPVVAIAVLAGGVLLAAGILYLRRGKSTPAARTVTFGRS